MESFRRYEKCNLLHFSQNGVHRRTMQGEGGWGGGGGRQPPSLVKNIN